MKTYSVISMKGGTGKSISAINIAHILATTRGARVLLVDCDKQGNVSKFFGLYGYGQRTLSDILTAPEENANKAIQLTRFERLHVLPANMGLLAANREILMDDKRSQIDRMRGAFAPLRERYDYCIIDCEPDLNMATINALVLSDAALIPARPDKFSFEGIGEFAEAVESLRAYNTALRVAGCFITMVRKVGLHAAAVDKLREISPVHVFDTVIRASLCVERSTFTGKPILEQSPGCNAAKDYKALVAELLSN